MKETKIKQIVIIIYSLHTYFLSFTNLFKKNSKDYRNLLPLLLYLSIVFVHKFFEYVTVIF